MLENFIRSVKASTPLPDIQKREKRMSKKDTIDKATVADPGAVPWTTE